MEGLKKSLPSIAIFVDSILAMFYNWDMKYTKGGIK